jgi:hypothetical protein
MVGYSLTDLATVNKYSIMFLDIIHRPAFILKHNVSETGFCLRLQVKSTQLVPIFFLFLFA